jgi:hypothetical protein
MPPISEEDRQRLAMEDAESESTENLEAAATVYDRLKRESTGTPAPRPRPSRAEIVKVLNRRLREVGLTNLSAHGARGTAWGWIEVSPKHREGESFRYFTPEESEKLGRIYGRAPGLTNVLSDEIDDWALKLGLLAPEDYHESPWRTLVRENRD